jgi:hypothetical protein
VDPTAVRKRRLVAILASLLLMVGALGAFQVAKPQIARASVASGDLIIATTQFNGGSGEQIAQVSGSNTTDLTTGASDQMPSVSLDGSRIVYQSGVSGDPTTYGLWVMNSDGSNKTQITEDCVGFTPPSTCGASYTDENPSWSPDGTKIVFTRQFSGGYAIDEVNADGTGLTTLVDDTTNGSFVFTGGPTSWHGTKILYTYYTSGSNELYIYDTSTSSSSLVDNGSTSGGDSDPVWSPDGSKIYFDNGSDVFGMTSSGGSLTQLTYSYWYGGSAYEPTVSPNGSTVAYTDNGDSIYTISSSANKQAGTFLISASGDSEPAYVLAAWPNANTKTIVALGDSVPAGEGINYGFTWNSSGNSWVQNGPSDPTWADTTKSLGNNYQDCHQSGYGYPSLFAVNSGNYQVYNMACTSASVLSEQDQTSGYTQGGVMSDEDFPSSAQPVSGQIIPAQLGSSATPACSGCLSVTPPTQFDANLTNLGLGGKAVVLLTVGADDVDFSDWIHQCYGSVCGSSSDTTTLNNELTTEKTDLETALKELNNRAGHDGYNSSNKLKVVLVDYYNPYGSATSFNSNCIDEGNGIEPIAGITSTEMTWIIDGLGNLDHNIQQEAQAARTNLNVKFVDLSGDTTQYDFTGSGGTDVMHDHDFCLSDPYAYGPSIDYPWWLNGNGQDSPAPMHPTPEGQRAIYQEIVAKVGL